MRIFMLACLLLSTIFIGNAKANSSLLLATTTSTENSGLLDYLSEIYTAETGNTLQWIAVGTGRALEHGRNCDVDFLLVHAPAAEHEFISDGYGQNRVEVMYNDFVLIGPNDDPAAVRDLNITDALSAIASSGQTFISRGDDSGTHKAELALWETVPEREAWYLAVGQGMMATINMSAEKNAYTLTDRGTWISFESTQEDNPLSILVEGDENLFNQYSVIGLNPAVCPNAKHDLASAFADWLVLDSTQEHIANYTLEGKQLFFPNAN